MRFNKKRGWTLFNRPSPEKEEAVLPETSVAEEQEPVSAENEMEKEVMSVTVEEPVQLSGDPIQSLFSSLGKFNRYLSQAQHAPDSGDWVEKCMNELAAGLEIAIRCHWTPVKDALIDTARILHSYDRVGRRRDSIPFLNSSYDILSLMVGDLIVDKVRSGVIQKWKELYRKTLDELEQAGIALAEDEEEMDAEMNVVDEVHASAEQDEAVCVEESVHVDEPVACGDDFEDEDAFTEDSGDATDDWEDQKTDPGEGVVFEDTGVLDMPLLTEPEEKGIGEEVSDETDAEDYEEEIVESDSILTFPGTTVRQQDIPPEDLDEDVIGDEDLIGEEENVDSGMEEESLLDNLPDEETDIPDSTEGVQDADGLFDGLDVAVNEVAEDTGEACSADTVEEEASSPVMPDTTEVSEMAEENVCVNEQDEPSRLLSRAQAAMAKGDVRSAKSMALELARTMARIEYEQAQAAAAESEQRLVENAQAIKTAQDNVEAAEKQLLQTEELLATREGECGACREQITFFDDELRQFQSELDDIDAQIEALQRRRVEQVNRMNNKHAEREETLNNESRLQTEMESLRQDADSVRQELEALREEKKRQIVNKREIELSICSAKEEAENRRLSLADIERTLSPQPSAPDSSGPKGDELFPEV